jgi:hypothetical protein
MVCHHGTSGGCGALASAGGAGGGVGRRGGGGGGFGCRVGVGMFRVGRSGCGARISRVGRSGGGVGMLRVGASGWGGRISRVFSGSGRSVMWSPELVEASFGVAGQA